MKRSTNKTD